MLAARFATATLLAIGASSIAHGAGLYLPNNLNTGRDAEILEFDSMTGAFIDTLVPNSSIGQIQGMTIGPDGNIYASYFDSSVNNNGRILRFDLAGNFLGTFVTPGSGGLFAPLGLTFGPDGNLYVGNAYSTVLRYDGATGASLGTFVTNVANPQDLVFDVAGNLYVSSGVGDTVTRYNGGTGALIDTFVAAGGAIDGPIGLAFGPNGDLFVAGAFSSNIGRYDSSGALVRNISGYFNGAVVLDVAFGPDGNLYAFVRPDGATPLTSGIVRLTADSNLLIDEFVSIGTGGFVTGFNTGMVFVDEACARWTAGGGATSCFTPAVVPVPAAVWLLGSALGVLGWAKRRTA
jgi:WD40 repeat protein